MNGIHPPALWHFKEIAERHKLTLELCFALQKAERWTDWCLLKASRTTGRLGFNRKESYLLPLLPATQPMFLIF